MSAEAVNFDPDPTCVLVIDGNVAFAELLNMAVDKEPGLAGLGFAGSAASGLTMCETLKPDVVVLDRGVRDDQGFPVIAQVIRSAPGTRLIVLAPEPNYDDLLQAAAAGACAFLPRGTTLIALLAAVRHAHLGAIEVDPAMLSVLPSEQDHTAMHPDPAGAMTERQLEVLRLMAEGSDVRTISRALGIAPNTCRGYVKAIHVRLGAHSQLQAVVQARRLGLLQSEPRRGA